MGLKYDYDDNGYFFNYFVLAGVLIALLIQTYYRYYAVKVTEHTEQKDQECQCQQCVIQRERVGKYLTVKRTKISWPFVYYCTTWLALLAVIGRISMTELVSDPSDKPRFDPYELLGLQVGALPEQIKKQFKSLSLQFHPDKVAEAEREQSNDRFIQISKAYKVLTDEETRRNWEEWGDPDGRQSIAFKYGIALPAWMVSGAGELWVLLAYSVIFGLGLPWLVNRWWSHSKSYTRDGIMNMSMSVYVQELQESDTSYKRLIEILSASLEFRENVAWRGDADMEAVMRVFNLVRDRVRDKTGEKLELPKKFNAPYVYKAYVLCFAHLFRLLPELAETEPALFIDASYIIPKMRHLCLKGLVPIASASSWLWQSVMCVRFARMLVQASTGGGNGVPYGLNAPGVNGRPTQVWSHMEANELHQLPYVNAEQIKAIRNHKRTKNVQSLADLSRILLPQRLDIFKQVMQLDYTSDDGAKKVREMLHVARRIPFMELVQVKFDCVGEQAITPGCLVTLSVTLKCVDFRKDGQEVDVTSVKSDEGDAWKQFVDTDPLPEYPDVDLDDDQADEDEEQKLLDAGGEVKVKRNNKLTKLLSGQLLDNPNLPVHAPYFPVPDPQLPSQQAAEDTNITAPVKPQYWLWLCNPRNNRVVNAPVQIMHLTPIPYADDLKDKTTLKGAGRQTVKIRFYAPQQAGTFQFQVVVESDAYTSGSLCREALLKVVAPSKQEEDARKREDDAIWREWEEEEQEYRAMIAGGQQSLLGTASGAVADQRDSSSDEDDSDADSEASSDDD